MKWSETHIEAFKLADLCKEAADQINAEMRQLPHIPGDGVGVYYNPHKKLAWLYAGTLDKSVQHKYLQKLSSVTKVVDFPHYPSGYPYDLSWIKVSYSPTIRAAFDTLNVTPGNMFGVIPNQPSPLAAGLTSGVLGAGLGYGLGYLGEKAMPNRWKKGRLRKSLGILGGLAGAGVGAGWAGANLIAGLPVNSPDLFNIPDGSKTAEADYGAGLAPIPVNEFNQIIWNDPRVSARLPNAVQAAATGLVSGASYMRGGAQLISPLDVGRMAAGMGSGYVSGALVGKALGLMLGMPDDVQEKLKNSGMFAGVIANLIPVAFGR